MYIMCFHLHDCSVYSIQGSSYNSTIYVCGNWKSERLFIQSLDKYKLITYYWVRHCEKDCVYFTANITEQEEPGLGPESLILMPGFLCPISHTLQKSHKNSSTK